MFPGKKLSDDHSKSQISSYRLKAVDGRINNIDIGLRVDNKLGDLIGVEADMPSANKKFS